MQAYYYSKTQGEERQILANQIVNKYDDYAKILIKQAEQATQEATHWQQVAANTKAQILICFRPNIVIQTNKIFFFLL
jgi:hypothetical protein